ncbi:hypothetical protein LUZ63_017208 [Rhynchospora breviuscula]|uniref:Uncharacterized protein n=1 Tax=Rhynchospora breviuscula TaxID=2022672 RepID=A0A9Q0C215_9POAL|nr:hypothetical protein LUZ63_017208 [Rhynchospora breviuscula]
MSQVSREIVLGNKEHFPVEPTNYNKFLVISLGTGSNKSTQKKFSAAEASNLGVLGWAWDKNNGTSPIIDIFSYANADMVDIHVAVLFQALQSEDKYLRIQHDALPGTLASMDNSSLENMDKLIQIGKDLLDAPVSTVNLETGIFEPDRKAPCTNAQMLTKFAEKLSVERKIRGRVPARM